MVLNEKKKQLGYVTIKSHTSTFPQDNHHTLYAAEVLYLYTSHLVTQNTIKTCSRTIFNKQVLYQGPSGHCFVFISLQVMVWNIE